MTCETCKELRERIEQLERWLIALASIGEAEELQRHCREILAVDEHRHDGVEFEPGEGDL